MLLKPAYVEVQNIFLLGLLFKFDIVTPIQMSETSSRSQGGGSVMLWLRTAAAQRARHSQVAVAIAPQSVNNKEASNACVNERSKILRSLNRIFVFEIVICIGAMSKDPARFVDSLF